MPATYFLSKLNEGQMHAHLSELCGVAGHYIIYSTLSIFPTFLILAVDRNFNFDGATARLMQFRLLHPRGGTASQQVKPKKHTLLYLRYLRFESCMSSSVPVSPHLSRLPSALPHNSPSPSLFHSAPRDLHFLSDPPFLLSSHTIA